MSIYIRCVLDGKIHIFAITQRKGPYIYKRNPLNFPSLRKIQLFVTYWSLFRLCFKIHARFAHGYVEISSTKPPEFLFSLQMTQNTRSWRSNLLHRTIQLRQASHIGRCPGWRRVPQDSRTRTLCRPHSSWTAHSFCCHQAGSNHIGRGSPLLTSVPLKHVIILSCHSLLPTVSFYN